MVEKEELKQSKVKIIFVMIDGLGDHNYYYPEENQCKY